MYYYFKFNDILSTLPYFTDLLYLTVHPLTTGRRDSVGLGNSLAAFALRAFNLALFFAG
jgi:hypothetical protein